jgi:enoyl-CoA hydratase/carnithine racemase
MAIYETILYRTEGPVATISLNRPERRNALNTQLFMELVDALDVAEADENVRCVVLTGEGPVFCAGQDLKFTLEADLKAYEEYGKWNRMGRDRIRKLEKPVVARVQGDAIGGGTYIATACDLVVAVKHARFAMREINAGVHSGGAHLFTVGRARAMEMNLLGRYVSAEEAERWGLINKAVEPDQLDAAVKDYVDQLCELPPLGLKYTKIATNLLLNIAGFDALLDARVGHPFLFLTEDNKEAKRAILEKRKPRFTGKLPG